MEDNFLCPVMALCRILRRWEVLGADEIFPICCYAHSKLQAAVITSSHVSTLIQFDVMRAYRDDNHLYRKNIRLFRTHSLRVFVCCALLVSGLSEEIVEHKLRWASSAWKCYIRESLQEVDKTALSLFVDQL